MLGWMTLCWVNRICEVIVIYQYVLLYLVAKPTNKPNPPKIKPNKKKKQTKQQLKLMREQVWYLKELWIFLAQTKGTTANLNLVYINTEVKWFCN